MRLLAAILGWVIGWVFRKIDQLDASIQLPPPRIELRPAIVGEHGLAEDEPEIQNCVRELMELGFDEAGTYDVLGLDQVRITGLIHPLTHVTASVWMQKNLMHLDLVTAFTDSTSLTSSNHAVGQELPGESGQERRRHPEVAPANLYRTHLAERESKPMLTMSVEGFAKHYEDRWAGQQDWLAARGGYTLDELRGLLQKRRDKVPEASLAFVRERIADSALRNWYATQLAPPFDYEEIKECLVIIHDELGPERTEYLFDRWSSGLDMPTDNLTPREVFATLRGREEACIERIWTKHSGLPADYYCPKELVAMLRAEMGLAG
jgi:hypothetical protein